MTNKENSANQATHKAEATAAKVGSEAAVAAVTKVANEIAAKRFDRFYGNNEVLKDKAWRRKGSFTRVFSDEELLEKFEAYDRILRVEIAPKILITLATPDMDLMLRRTIISRGRIRDTISHIGDIGSSWRDGFLKDFLSLFPNSTFYDPNSTDYDDSITNLNIAQLLMVAKNLEYTAVLRITHYFEKDYNCLIHVYSVVNGACVQFTGSNTEYDLNSAMMGASFNTSMSEAIGRMIQSLFTNNVRKDLDFTCFATKRRTRFQYIIGGRVGTQGVGARPRLLLTFDDCVAIGTYDTKSGEFEFLSRVNHYHTHT